MLKYWNVFIRIPHCKHSYIIIHLDISSLDKKQYRSGSEAYNASKCIFTALPCGGNTHSYISSHRYVQQLRDKIHVCSNEKTIQFTACAVGKLRSRAEDQFLDAYICIKRSVNALIYNSRKLVK